MSATSTVIERPTPSPEPPKMRPPADQDQHGTEKDADSEQERPPKEKVDQEPDQEESAFPADKRAEALEAHEERWAADPENPRNWRPGKKWLMAGIVSLYTFISPVSSSMMASALLDVQDHYHIKSDTVTAMTLSIFLLAYALGPLILSPLSEVYGRTWVLHISNVFFLIFNLACAFSPNVGALIAFRFLAGIGGSAPVTIGGGSIGDLFAEHERALAMAMYTLGPLIGPSVGPVAGGFIAQTIGFKWIFIILAIFAGVSGVFGVTFLRETYAPVIRLRRLKREIKDYEKDGRPLEHHHTVLLDQHESIWHVLAVNLSRPFVLLFGSFICFILSLYMALIYGYYYLMFATFPQLFSGVYGFSTGIAGLAYLGPGVGFVASTFYGAFISDSMYKKLCARNGGVSKPEFRIPSLIFASFLVPVGLFWYGWSAQAKIHYIMPIIGAGIFGFGMMAAFLPITLYLVDTFRYAASAIAAATVIRSSFGFFFPLFGEQMFAALDYGPGYSLLAGLAIIIGMPFPVWIYYYGEKIRLRSNLSR